MSLLRGTANELGNEMGMQQLEAFREVLENISSPCSV